MTQELKKKFILDFLIIYKKILFDKHSTCEALWEGNRFFLKQIEILNNFEEQFQLMNFILRCMARFDDFAYPDPCAVLYINLKLILKIIFQNQLNFT